MTQRTHRLWVVLMLATGISLWLAIGTAQYVGMTRWRWVAVAIAALAATLPPVRKGLEYLLDRIRHPSPRSRAIAATTIAILAGCYFIYTAVAQDRDLFAKTHDECSYLIQMQMLSHGRLWMSAHPMADFFDSFYILTRPVYASIYFPGTAILYVPSIWLGWPAWLMPVMTAAAVVGLLYRIVTEMVDGVAGALSAVLLVSLSWFRMLSVMLMSQVPLMLMGLLMLWAWLRWRENRRTVWLLCIGIFAGWAAITRPLDALCFALPIAAAILTDLRRQPVIKQIKSLACIAIAAGPFLLLQGIFNYGVTGSAWQTPAGLYAERDYPGTSLGFHPPDPNRRPTSTLPQKQLYYANKIAPYIAEHQPARLAHAWATRWLPMIADVTLPVRVLIVLLPLGLLGLVTLSRWVLLATLPLFMILYLFWTFFLEHYAVISAPAVILLVVLGCKAIAGAFPGLQGMLVLALLAIAATSTHELNAAVDDESFPSPVLRFAAEQLPQLVHRPAVVLFRFDPANNIAEEPVYNTDSAWPDNAPLIRAHDLGTRNTEIFHYYANLQPNRWFYRFDRKTNILLPLGTARDLAASAAPTPDPTH